MESVNKNLKILSQYTLNYFNNISKNTPIYISTAFINAPDPKTTRTMYSFNGG